MLRGAPAAIACLLTVVVLAGCISASAKGAGGVPVGLGAAKANNRLLCDAQLKGIDLQAATIRDLQEALATGRITSVDLVQAYLERIEALDDLKLNSDVPRNPPEPLPDTAGHYVSLNSVRVINPRALEWAEQRDAERKAGIVHGPMHGIPVLLKDNIGTSEMPTTAGSIALATNVPDDATQVKNLMDAGAIILGKAELAEFANWMATGTMPNGYSSIGGQVMNAYTGRNPSGSSSGSGVAASMAFAAGTVGSETSGSIIGPSSSNSVVGLKPTMGIVSRYGVVPLAANYDMTGPMVRYVEDAAIMLEAMVSKEVDPNDPESVVPPDTAYTSYLRPDALAGVRVGVAPGSAQNYRYAIENLTKLGAEVVPVNPNLHSASNVYLSTFGVVSNEFKNGITDYLRSVAGPDLPIDHLTPLKTPREVRSLTQIVAYNQQNEDKIPYGQQNLILSDSQPGDPATFLAGGLVVRESSRAVADRIFQDVDVIVGFGLGYYGMGTAAGYPSLTVPAGYGSQGGRLVSPQSITFTGPAFSDGELLGYAYAFEQATQLRVRPEYQNATLLQSVCSTGVEGAPGKAELSGTGIEDYDMLATLPRLSNGQRVPLI